MDPGKVVRASSVPGPEGPAAFLPASRVPTCQITLIGRVLAPVIWLRRYLDEVKEAIFAMMWRELVHNEPESSEVLNLVAFLLFSAAALYTYRADAIPYVSWALLALWPLGLLEARLGRRAGPVASVQIAFQGRRVRWRETGGRTKKAQEALLQHEDIEEVAVRWFDCPGASSGTPGWQVVLATRDGPGHIVHFAPGFAEAWRQALPLASGLKKRLVAAGSLGCGSGAEVQSRPVLDAREDRFWSRQGIGGATLMTRDWHSIRLASLLRAGLEDAGFLLFLIVVGALMGRYGELLNWLLGRFGVLDVTPVYVDLSRGVFRFLVPSLSWEDAGTIALALAAMVFGIWQQSRPQELRVDAERVRWRSDDRRLRSIATPDLVQMLLFYDPQPTLILVGRESCLVMDRIASPVEMDELYAKLLEALAPYQVLTETHLDRLQDEQTIRLARAGV
jgi:hypothetical protein